MQTTDYEYSLEEDVSSILLEHHHKRYIESLYYKLKRQTTSPLFTHLSIEDLEIFLTKGLYEFPSRIITPTHPERKDIPTGIVTFRALPKKNQ